MKRRIAPIIRRIMQVLSFILFPGYFVIIWNALQSVFTALIFGDFAWSTMQSSIFTLIAVVPITLLFGRFFCGYLCAFGSMQDFVGFIAKKLGVKKHTPGKMADRRLRRIKYGILALSAVIWAAEITVADAVSPWSVFGEYASYKAWVDPSGLFSVGGVLLALIIVSAFFVSRAFCRYLCPLGGFFAILSEWRVFRLRKNVRCVGCDLCAKKCVMGIDVHAETDEYGKVVSGECINCFACMDTCAPRALRTNPQEAVAGTAAVLSMVGLFYIGNAIPPVSADAVVSSSAYVEATELPTKAPAETPSTAQAEESTETSSELQTETSAETSSETSTETSSETSSETPSQAPTTGKYADGTYTGTGSGYRGTTEVSVVVAGGEITSITVESTGDDRQFFGRAESGVIDEVLQTQGVDVQAVSGATYSSNGILEAVANALGIDFTNTNSTIPRGHGRH